MTILEKIIDVCNLPLVVKKKHGISPEVTAEQFINSILVNDTISQASKHLNIGEQTLNRVVAKHLIPLFGKLNGGGETWKFILLAAAEHKECHQCNQIKPYSKFGQDIHKSDGKFRKCKYCRSFDNSSLYQARKLRIPPWYSSEKDLIAEFYENCPSGYHVDHIIPLQGTFISGLHTLNNLQYLPASENLKKGNKFEL